MTTLTTLTEIHKLEERYPFNEEELEILVRCHDHIKNDKDPDDFLMKLAVASPYSRYFLPGDETRDRVNWLEDNVLPCGFTSELRAAISTDSFVDYANEGQSKSLERFIEGIADTGRRGPREALRVLFNILGDDAYEPNASDLIDLCIRLAVAAEVVALPNLNKDATLIRLKQWQEATDILAKSLTAACDGKPPKRKDFVNWAEDKVPMLHAPLYTFMNTVVFNERKFPDCRIPYNRPLLAHASDIFTSDASPLLPSLSFMSHKFGGKWHRLYSSETDGRCLYQLEWSLLGYGGPSLLVIRTEDNGTTLGAFASTPWKDSTEFYGDCDCFVFQLEPSFGIFRAVGKDDHFMFSHSDFMTSSLSFGKETSLRGIGFGGTKEEPRLFIPESLEHCSARVMDDKTYEAGDLVPQEALERFEIRVLEVWGVGGDEEITKALRDRAEYRERTNTAIHRARVVSDKSQFIKDFQTGLIPNTLYAHQEQARGRHDFSVDDEHGGYKIDRD